MAKRGRKPILDEYKRREILAILAVGGSRPVAAAYVGCTASTIRNTADRDPEFGRRLRDVEARLETICLRSVYAAAMRATDGAAAWLAERGLPFPMLQPTGEPDAGGRCGQRNGNLQPAVVPRARNSTRNDRLIHPRSQPGGTPT